MAYITRDDVNKILKMAPPHMSRPAILSALQRSGHEIEGVNTFKKAAKLEVSKRQGFFSDALGDVSEAVKGVGEAAVEAGRGVTEALKRVAKGEISPITGSFAAVGEAAAGVSRGIGEVVTGVAKVAVPQAAEEAVSRQFRNLAESDIGRRGLELVQRGGQEFESFRQVHPEAAEIIESAAQIGLLGAEVAGLRGAAAVTRRGVAATRRAAERATVAVEDVAERIKSSAQRRIEQKAATRVEEIVSPKLTKREVKKALTEGRIVRAGELKKRLGFADQVVAEQRVREAANVVLNRIDDAPRLSDQQIASAAKDQISIIAKEVRPKLKKVAIPEDNKNNILNSYADLKESQLESPILTDRQISKAQQNFEKFLVRTIDGDNANDLWDIITDYDRSIRKRIKEADSQSIETLQEMKDMWLDNRRILRDALDDIVEEAEETVRKEFKDMSSLYTARENIINNANFARGADSFRSLLAKRVVAGVAGGTIGGAVITNLID